MHARVSLLAIALAFYGCASRPIDTASREGEGKPATIAYHIAIPDPSTHYVYIGIDASGLDGRELRLQMPVWSPGRYARMDFARNVQRFAATGPAGAALPFDKINGSLWRIHLGGATSASLSYRVFINELDGTFSVADSNHVNWNGPSLFMYVVGHKSDPVTLTIAPPAGWHVLNGDSQRLDQLDFTFENYDRLIDTPTEIAPSFDVDSFRVDGRLYRLMIHHNGPQNGQRERFTSDVKRIVEAQNRVIGPPPLEKYTFLFNLGFAGGDGMEHLYSTQIIDSRRWMGGEAVLPGVSTASHEYFHTWNMKRIRAAALGPFDYTTEQYQPSLWQGEGWTQYYGEITLHRAGIIDRAAYYRMLSGTIRATTESPSRKETSPRSASFNAPFWDGASGYTKVDGVNGFLSYYTSGCARAAILDIEIRARSNGTKSLDDVLRLLKTRTWDASSNSYYLQGRGFTEDDIEKAVSDVAGSDFHSWFERYVGGTEDLPWLETLAKVGLRLTVTAGPQGREYSLTETPDASPAVVKVRDGWLAGTMQH